MVNFSSSIKTEKMTVVDFFMARKLTVFLKFLQKSSPVFLTSYMCPVFERLHISYFEQFKTFSAVFDVLPHFSCSRKTKTVERSIDLETFEIVLRSSVWKSTKVCSVAK